VLSNHNTLLPIGQEAADPIDYPGTETTLDQFDPERGMKNSVEGFCEVQEYNEYMKPTVDTVTNVIHL